jgi:hypothetical protein
MPDSGRGRDWRARAIDRLLPLVADLEGDTKRASVGWFDIEQLLGERDASRPFRWSARFARREIGLPALQELAAASEDNRKMTPVEAVVLVVRRLVSVGREGWADREGAAIEDWLCSIGDGGRAAATRDAVSWVTACRTQIRWPPRDVRAPREGTWFGTVRKDVLALRARIDLGPARAPGVILTSAPQRRTQLSLAYIALVRAIDAGVLPDRVTALHLPSGDRTHVVPTDETLRDVLDLCARAIRRWAEEQRAN